MLEFIEYYIKIVCLTSKWIIQNKIKQYVRILEMLNSLIKVLTFTEMEYLYNYHGTEVCRCSELDQLKPTKYKAKLTTSDEIWKEMTHKKASAFMP